MPRPRAIEGSFGFRGERQPLMAPILRDHAHGDVELNLLEGGSATCFLAGRFVELPRERVAVFWAALPHRIVAVPKPGHILWVTIQIGRAHV